MDTSLATPLKNASASLLDLLASLPLNLPDGTRNKALASLQKLQKLDDAMARDNVALESIRSDDELKSITTIDKMEAAYHKITAKDTSVGPNTDKIGELREKMENATEAQEDEDDDDDDVEIADAQYINYKDPFSQKKITDPIINRVCRHVYERETMRVMMQQIRETKQLVQCPVAMCRNKKNLTMDDFDDYPEFFDLCQYT